MEEVTAEPTTSGKIKEMLKSLETVALYIETRQDTLTRQWQCAL
jgi:hypothetical protein